MKNILDNILYEHLYTVYNHYGGAGMKLPVITFVPTSWLRKQIVADKRKTGMSMSLIIRQILLAHYKGKE